MGAGAMEERCLIIGGMISYYPISEKLALRSTLMLEFFILQARVLLPKVLYEFSRFCVHQEHLVEERSIAHQSWLGE